MRIRRTSIFLILFLVPIFIVGLIGCAAGPNDLRGSLGSGGSVAGFWLGLWHGVILPISFIISLFSDKVTIYEVHNSGGWYNFGFLLGAAMIWGGGGATARGNGE
ncbi:MAG TPA: hypothetical protein VGR39_02065 [Candidatus Acidoferrales bacterium]|nr:hypothetical protein [Candidatus Acidoferrales bacterium]